MTDVTLVPVLNDNYAYILTSGDQSAVIDPGEADPVISKLEELGLKPDYILNTHHHSDHIAGNKNIREKYGAQLIAPASETSRIKDIDIPVSEKDTFTIGDEDVHIVETPGHTTGHICFWLPDSKILFSGDLLFSMGCGRAFEGSAEDLFHSISKIKPLPAETKIYCGHEYTLSNAEFSLTIEPENMTLQKRYKEVQELRDNGIPTIPTSLGLELEINPFLRAQNSQRFTKIRTLKDNF